MAKVYPTSIRSRRYHWWYAIALILGCLTLAGLWWVAVDVPSSGHRADRAELPTHVPEPSAAFAPPEPTPLPIRLDRRAATPPLAERWIGPATADARQYWRIVPTGDDLIPVARVVDHFARDPVSGEWHPYEQEIMRPDAVIVAVPAGFSVASVVTHLDDVGFVTDPAHANDAVVVVRLSDATLDAVPAALARLRVELPVFLAEPDFLRFPAQATPDDYDANSLWGLENIEAPAAWSITSGASSVVVGVLDSGMDVTHPDLAPNLWTNPGEIPGNSVDDDGNGFVDDVHGWDFSANSAAIIDSDGHGTHVSGTIGAAGNNGQGVTGVNWRVQMIPLRVGNITFPDSALINATRYVTALRTRPANPVNVVAVNASLGGSGFNSTLRTEIGNAGSAGIVFVAAAGNDGSNNDIVPTYPASYDLDSIIAVASIHQGNARSRFSSFGVTTVDLAAPGTAVFSTLRNGTYGYQNGTSMAAPHVTGAVALVAAAEPALTMAQRRARILQTVEPVAALDGVVATGGKLNLRRAVAPTLVRPRVVISAPAARVVAMDRAGLGLALSATVLPDAGNVANATLVWDAIEGPAAVAFTATAGGSTIATFPAVGRYRLRVRATNGPLTESDAIVVAVGSVQPEATGLRALWSFDEASGDALDSSGDSRNGTLNGATRTAGVLGSALSLNGTTDNVGFAAPALSRVTIAGWARATGAGNSVFPRIVHMRPGLMFFGLDDGSSQDDGNVGTLKFALDDGTTTPVWHSPPGTIGLNTWYHVAVSFDPAASVPAPRLYINGVPQTLGTQPITMASVPTVPVGQGFIGDRGDATREWLGQLDEIRIYDRELTVSECALLGHEVTLRALTTGTLVRGSSSNSLVVPLTFSPATTGLAAPTFAQLAWSVGGTGASMAPATGAASSTLTVAMPGSYLVRFDGTTTDGVHVVRTLSVTVTADPITITGYFVGSTSEGGSFAMVVDDNGNGTFFGGAQRGHFRRGFSVTSTGAFSFTDLSGATISGQIDAAGAVTGTISSGGTFAGGRLNSGFGASDSHRDGDYSGWVLDSGIRAAAHVERGRVALVVQENGVHRAAEGVIDASGSFALAPSVDATFNGSAGGDKLTADIALPGRAARRIVLLRDGAAPARRLVNLSLRGVVGTGDAVLIPGFVVQGTDPLPMLVRAVGPGLADFNVPGFIGEPRLQVFRGSTLAHENFGWASSANASDISAAATRVNAFALNPARLDSATLAPLAAGTYTATITGNDGGTGVALAEAYDARLAGEDARLINLSGRGHVGTGANILIGGFVIAGDAPALVLVRGVGPTLSSFNVPGALPQPVLTLFRGQTSFATVMAWSAEESADDIAAAAALTSAFALPDDSADSALLLFLEPGSYTAQISGANGSTGIALVEVYLVPDF